MSVIVFVKVVNHKIRVRVSFGAEKRGDIYLRYLNHANLERELNEPDYRDSLQLIRLSF